MLPKPKNKRHLNLSNIKSWACWLFFCSLPYFWLEATGYWYFHSHSVDETEKFARLLWSLILPALFLVGISRAGTREKTIGILSANIILILILNDGETRVIGKVISEFLAGDTSHVPLRWKTPQTP